MWPEKRNEAELEQIRKDIGEYKFNAIHQQDPRPREGKYFKEDYFKVIETSPTNIIQEVQWTDLAATSYPPSTPITLRGPASATIRLALTDDLKLVVTFIDEFWEESEDVKVRVINNTKLGGKGVKHRIPQDPAQAGKSQVNSYRLQLPGYQFKGIIEKTLGDKEARAEPVGDWAKVNKIYVVDDGRLAEDGKTNLVQRFIKQCANFPGGLHKDMADALSGAFSELDVDKVRVKRKVNSSLLNTGRRTHRR